MKLLLVALFLLSTNAHLQSQEITMFSGFGTKFFQDNERISKKEADRLLSNNRDSRDLWKKAKRQNYGTAIGLLAEFAFVVWAFNRAVNYQKAWVPYAAALGSAGVATGFSYNRLRLQREAILAYNESFDRK